MPPIDALGYNAQWPGPTIRVNQGDKVRAIFTNNLDETTGVHFHGVEFDDFFQDGVPFVTQQPIVPGETLRLRLRGEQRRLADVPLAPQRHGPGGSRPARGVHRRPGPDPVRLRPRVPLDLERPAGRLHDQRPRLPGGRAGRRRPGRDGPHPVHERGDHDAPVASPRDADATWSRATGCRSGTAGFKTATRSGSIPASARTSVVTAKTARRVGVPLPHPAARRRHGRDVRDGQLDDRRPGRRTTSTRSSRPPWPDAVGASRDSARPGGGGATRPRSLRCGRVASEARST